VSKKLGLTQNILLSNCDTIFGAQSSKYKHIEEISKNYAVYFDSTPEKASNDEVYKYEVVTRYLHDLIKQIEFYGLEDITKVKNYQLQDKASNIINVSQQQNQSQNQNFDINLVVNTILEELSEEEKSEFKQILVEYKSEGNFNKINKYFSKLSSDVLANILASIITNPVLLGNTIDQILTTI